MFLSPLQIILLIIILLVLFGVFKRMVKKDITMREFWLWSLFWLVSGGVVLWPESTNRLAKFLGIGRGADLIVYFSTAFLVYAVFRIYVRIERIERDITRIVRSTAIEEKLKQKKSDE